MKQTQRPIRSPKQSQKQRQSRGQSHTQRRRQALDSLDASPMEGVEAGPEVLQVDFGWEGMEGVDILDVCRNPDDDCLTLTPDLEPDDAAPAARQFLRVEDIVGSRPQRVAIQLNAEADGTVRADPVVTPRTPDEREALHDMCKLVKDAFKGAQRKFSKEEWNRLLGREDATPRQRLFLLAHVAVDADVKDEIAKSANLQRYGKVAAFPDGMPFDIRLLLPDRRGKGKGRRAGDEFDQLPDAIKLQAYQAVLRDERRDVLENRGKSLDDAKFFQQILIWLQREKLLSAPPKPAQWTSKLRLFRQRLRRNGLEHLALKQSDRTRQYAASQESAESREEAQP